METALLSGQNAWLSLGIPGAALFIVLTVVVLMFAQQSKSIDKLCTKIDEVITNFTENTKKLNEVVIQNDYGQSQLLDELQQIHKTVNDVNDCVKDVRYQVGALSGNYPFTMHTDTHTTTKN